MGRWTCPDCEREFGRSHQSHVCVPGCGVDGCFAGRPAEWRRIYDAVAAHVADLGPVHEDAVRVGVFLKRGRTLVEVRPRARGVALLIALPRRVADPRISRVLRASAGRFVHQVTLTDADQVDDRVHAWLTEAYDAAG